MNQPSPQQSYQNQGYQQPPSQQQGYGGYGSPAPQQQQQQQQQPPKKGGFNMSTGMKIAGGLAAAGLVGFGINKIVDHEEEENDRISRLEREEREDRYNGRLKKKTPRKEKLSKNNLIF